MTYVLTMMAQTGSVLDDASVGQTAARIAGGHRGAMRRLSESACELDVFEWDGAGVAGDWSTADELVSFFRASVTQQSEHTIDVALLPASARRKRLLISDMDSTMIEQECIDEIADFAGLKDHIAAITKRAMNGELDFAEALQERVGLLKGLPETTLQTVIDERLTLMPGARTLVQTMKASGATCILVSGGFTFFTERIARMIGFDAHFANELEIVDGKLTGRVVEPILGAQAKRDTLERYISDLGLSQEDTLAVGDGANDAAMVEAAGLGVAFHPHPVLADKADAVIRHGDLTSLLYLQGFQKSDFVTT